MTMILLAPCIDRERGVDRCSTITNADLCPSHITEEVRPALLKESSSELYVGTESPSWVCVCVRATGSGTWKRTPSSDSFLEGGQDRHQLDREGSLPKSSSSNISQNRQARKPSTRDIVPRIQPGPRVWKIALLPHLPSSLCLAFLKKCLALIMNLCSAL